MLAKHFLTVVELRRVSVAMLAEDEDRARAAVVFPENGVRISPNRTAKIGLGICEQQDPRIEPHGGSNHHSTGS